MSSSDFFEVLRPGTPRADKIRTTFRNRMEKLYTGWSDNFDRRFDNHSFLFVLCNQDGEYLATCRLVFKQGNREIYTTPMEAGDISQFFIPHQFYGVCEGGMVSFNSKETVLRLMYGVVRWMVENQIKHCYTTYDSRNILIQRLYTRTLGFSKVEGAVVQFSGFKSKKTGLPVEWQVLEASQDASSEVLNRLRSLGMDFPYEIGKYPRLTDWLHQDRVVAKPKEVVVVPTR